MSLLSIVLPCYEEALSLPELYKKAIFITDNYDIEIIFLDNGSKDQSWEIMQSLKEKERIRFIKLQTNKGYGFGIKYALNFCNGKYIGWTHADLQTDLFDVIKAFELLSQKINCKSNNIKYALKGKRLGRKASDMFLSTVMGFITKLIFFSNNLYEINAQPSIFDRSILNSLKKTPDDYNFDLGVFLIANSKKYTFLRLPVLFPERLYGKSHWNINLISKVKFIINTFGGLIKMRIKI